VAARFVEQVDDHRQGGGLARPGRAGHDDQAVARLGQPAGQVRREAGPGEVRDGVGHQPQARPDLAPGVEQVDAEPGQAAVALQVEGEIEILPRLKRRVAVGGAEGGDQLPRLVGGQGRLGQLDQVAVEAQGRGIADDEVQVAGPAVHRPFQPGTGLRREAVRRGSHVGHGTAFASSRVLGTLHLWIQPRPPPASPSASDGGRRFPPF
jgi:hypothetical protein